MIDEFVKNFYRPENEEVVEEFYKLIVINEQNIIPYCGPAFYVQDPICPDNSGIYWFKDGFVFRYFSDDKSVEPIGINIPDNWKEIVHKDYNIFNEVLN